MKNEFFIGRTNELAYLEKLYNSSKFEMLILHGRRRVGKSYLLGHFANLHKENTILFSADKSSERSNVQNFCEKLKAVLHLGDFINSLSTWKEIYSFLEQWNIKDRLVIIIDEFTYLYNSNSAYDSILQNAIDNILKKKNIFLILCGSEVSVIEEIIDNASKPLYGRKTAALKLLPFTYKEAKDFFPKYDEKQAITVYSAVGGIPLYLTLFDDRKTVKENIIEHCLSSTGLLFNEIETILRMELRETAFYKDILLAINSGASTLKTIADKIGQADSAKISKYIKVLINLDFIKKEIPCGEKEKKGNTLYSIKDNYFAFYFTFIYKNQSMLNGLIPPQIFYDQELTEEKLNMFIGHRFESICASYLREQFYNGKMPFFANKIGRWWGTNPLTHKQEEIDIVALDDKENALICECKYTNKAFDIKELNDLRASSVCLNRQNKYFMIFSKNGIAAEVKKQIENDKSYFVVSMQNL